MSTPKDTKDTLVALVALGQATMVGSEPWPANKPAAKTAVAKKAPVKKAVAKKAKSASKNSHVKRPRADGDERSADGAKRGRHDGHIPTQIALDEQLALQLQREEQHRVQERPPTEPTRAGKAERSRQQNPAKRAREYESAESGEKRFCSHDPYNDAQVALATSRSKKVTGTPPNTSGWIVDLGPAEDLDPANLEASNLQRVPPIPMQNEHEFVTGAAGLQFLPMVGYETDYGILDEGFHPEVVTQFASRPVPTVGDGTCALHALLGRHVLNGRIVCAPDGVTASQLDKCSWIHAKRHALSILEMHRESFVLCAKQMQTDEVADKRKVLTTSANVESHNLEMQRGAAVYDLIQQHDLCPEGSDFFREMKDLREYYRHRAMEYAEFMAVVDHDMCREAYRACPLIRTRVREVADFSVRDEAIQRQRDVVRDIEDEFFFSGEGAAAYKKRFVTQSHYLTDTEIGALAVACNKAVILVQSRLQGAWTCQVMNRRSSKNLRVILQQGDSGSGSCHYSLLRVNHNELSRAPQITSPPLQSSVEHHSFSNQGQSQTRNSPEGKLDQRTSSNALQNMPSPPPPPQQRNVPLQLHEDLEFQTALVMNEREEDEQESTRRPPAAVRDLLQQKDWKTEDVARTGDCFYSALLAAKTLFSSVDNLRQTVFHPANVSTTMRGFAQAACDSADAAGKYKTVEDWQDWHGRSSAWADSHAISWTAEFLRVQINVVELTKEGTTSVKWNMPESSIEHTVWLLQEFGGEFGSHFQAFTEEPKIALG